MPFNKISLRYLFSVTLVMFGLIKNVTALTNNVDPSYFSQISKIINESNPKNVDEFLSLLPEDWRKEFSMVYESGSLQTGTLEMPRVILTTPDHQLYLTFTGHQEKNTNRPADDKIEMIESYGKSAQRYAEISFEDSVPKINYDPAICLTCHQGGSAMMQSYPRWVGFYGTDHNGILYGENRGTSKIPVFEFEESYLKQFVSKVVNSPRYRHLKNIDGLTLSKLSAQNTILGTSIIGRLETQQTDLILAQKKTIEEVNEAYLFSRWVSPEDATSRFSELNDIRYEYYVKQFDQLKAQHDQEVLKSQKTLFNRYKDLVNRFGSQKDKATFATIYFENGPENAKAGDNVFNFFNTRIRNSSSGIYYSYLKRNNPESYPLPVGSSIFARNHGGVSGTTFGFIFTDFPPGFENGGGPKRFNARNYRDMNELYAWITDFVKDTKYEDIKAYPELDKGIQLHLEAYLSILRSSPIFNKEQAQIFLNIKAMSPNTRAHYLEVLGDK